MNPILALGIIITIIILAIATTGYLIYLLVRMVRNRGGSPANKRDSDQKDSPAMLTHDTGHGNDAGNTSEGEG